MIYFLESVIFPTYELLQMKASGGEGKLFSMRFLSESTYTEINKEFTEFITGYEKWIDEQYKLAKKLDSKYFNSAEKNILDCRETCSRLKSNFELLENPVVFKAFCFANEAMLRQRYGLNLKSTDDAHWYPFQLMFLRLKSHHQYTK